MSYSELGGPSAGTIMVDELVESSEEGFAKGPERTLLAAVLFDGLQAYMSYVCAKGREARKRYREAFNWVNSKDDQYIFSFENVCEGLGINPQFLRVGLSNACASQVVDRKRSRRHF
ncbi:MAG: hypothetical protein EBZ48_10610 [Proteobacteria bacterium]|nr:hypothetical protein [Pseudomonadota bacterium]